MRSPLSVVIWSYVRASFDTFAYPWIQTVDVPLVALLVGNYAVANARVVYHDFESGVAPPVTHY